MLTDSGWLHVTWAVDPDGIVMGLHAMRVDRVLGENARCVQRGQEDRHLGPPRRIFDT